MILKLHITLENTKAIYRTVELEETMTFEQLTEVIQIAFDHTDLGSYLFHITKSNGQPASQYIGIDFEQDFLIDESLILDDEDEIIANWLKKEGDFAQYILANNEITFNIEVKRYAKGKQTVNYPRCIAGEGHIEGEWGAVNTEEISEDMSFICGLPDDLVEDFLDSLMDDEEDIEADWTYLFEQADALKKLKPWEYLRDYNVIALEHPESQLMMYVSVMGAAGQEYGLAIYIEDAGRKMFEKMQSGELSPDFYLDLHCLNVSFVNREELTKEEYELIKGQGLSFRGKNQCIQLRSYQPGQFPWIPDGHEAELMIHAISETIEVIEQRKKGWEFPDLPVGLYYLRKLEWLDDKWEQVEHIISFDEEQDELYPVAIDASEFEFKQLSKKKIEHVELEFDLFYLPKAIQEGRDERPYYPLMIIAIDIQSGMVVHNQVLPMMKEVFITQVAFMELLKSLPYKPNKVYVSGEVWGYIAELAQQTKTNVIPTTLQAMPQFKMLLAQMP